MSTSRDEAIEAMAQYLASMSEDSLARVGIYADVREREMEIREERQEAAADE